MSFYGNPNVTITSIDTSGGIACSRTSGQTPAFFQFSASAITATGTSAPYRDPEYSWDCGDPSGTEIFTHPVTGLSANLNTSQTGPEAAYCYRSAGIYTVTLTIRGKNGSGFTTATKTQDITVSAYSASGGHWYFDSNAAGGGDGSIGLPFNTVAQINTKANVVSASLHIKRGSSWVGSTGITISKGPMRIDAYGTGDKPIIDVNTGSNPAINCSQGGSGVIDRSDVVVSDLSPRRSGNSTSILINGTVSNANCTMNNVYFDNCDGVSAISSGTGGIWVTVTDTFQDATKMSNSGIWGGSFVPQSGDASQGIGILGGPVDWGFYVGFSISGTGHGAGLQDHHIYPSLRNHALFSYIDFGGGLDRHFCINGNWDDHDNPSSLSISDYWCVSDCNFFGTQNAFDAGNADNDSTLTQFPNYVVQQCSFHDLLNDGSILIPCATGVTLRDSIVYNCDGGSFWAPSSPADANNHVYRVKHYGVGGAGDAFDWSKRTWTNPQTFTDNIMHDTRATARPVQLDSFANGVSVGYVIDRNQYYVPNDSSSPDTAWYDGVTAKTFAQWQAFGFDVNGSVADPGWIDPGNGDFSVVSAVAGAGFAPDPFSADDLANLRHHQEELKKSEQRRSKTKTEHARKLRDAVEEVYDKLAGIAPAEAAKVAAVIPATAKITETAAKAEAPAIDWSKVTSAQIAKVIATMDAYAAQLEAEQRQQSVARADAARHQDEDDIETLLMAVR